MYSVLAKLNIPSPNSSARKHKIDHILIHCMAGPLTAKSCGEMFKKNGKSSSNYGIGPDGQIAVYVDESRRAWCTGGTMKVNGISGSDMDHRGVSIEVSSSKFHPYKITDKAFESLVRLCADICFRNGIKQMKWKNNKAYVGKPAQQNVAVHRWFANKACPGDYIYERLGTICDKVNYMLGNPSNFQAGITSGSSAGSSSSSSSGDGESSVAYDTVFSNGQPLLAESKYGLTVNLDDKDDPNATLTSYIAAATGKTELFNDNLDIKWSNLTPYIVSLTDKNKDVIMNYANMKAAGVSGYMVYVGQLFDSAHREVRYQNPSLVNRMVELEYHKAPFGFYYNCKAHNVQEASKEMYEFSFAIRKYPPVLGAWIQPNMPFTKPAANDIIIRRYQEELIRLGLKGRIGFYCKASDLDKFSWSKFSDDWLLWVNAPLNNMWNIDETITPTFFDPKVLK